MARLTYRAARARAANGLELGLRVATAIRQENDPPRPYLRAVQIRERGMFGDPGEANPPPASRRPVRPIGPRPWASKPASSAEQTTLDGESVRLPGPPDPPPVQRGQQQALPVMVARSYRSKAWAGTVTEPPLDLEA
jgi:hypothetical protein